jgi:hypothetical protein
MTRRRKFQRPTGQRRYRKLFVIAVEGAKTEPRYFAIFNNQQSFICVNCLRGRNDSSPPQVLKRMKDHLKKAGLKKSDEAWLVVDKDNWTDDQLALLFEWSQEEPNFGFALSNPKFEYWLLLHFEAGVGITSSQDCSARLKRRLPDYDKGIDPRKFPQKTINEAIRRARQRDNPSCLDWPRATGSTTVYRLVENILHT